MTKFFNQQRTGRSALSFLATSLLAGLFASSPAFAADGKAVFEGTCKVCHAAGLMGAPKVGDKDAWAPRIAQGVATLNEHAVKGFKAMPPKGGKSSLSEEEVHAAVAYMVEASK